MAKKLTAILIAIMMVLCFTACSGNNGNEGVEEGEFEIEEDYDFVDINKLIDIQNIKGYEEEKGEEVDSILLHSDKTSLSLYLATDTEMDGLYYVEPQDIEEYIENDEVEKPKTEKHNGKTYYVQYGNDEIGKNAIYAYTICGEYVLCIDYYTNEDEDLTQEQNEAFNTILDNIKFLK